ncbi:MAG TPA: hypothetical protein VIJ79_14335 [Acidobacteriaceae bacterium]
MVKTMPVPPAALYNDIPPGFWVALSMDEQHVIASAKTMDEVVSRAESIGELEYVIDRVPPKDLLVL